MGKLKIWATEEDQILGRISSSIKSKRWKKASEELHRYGYERTDVECRERYINHLDPSVNKQLWSDEELQILYKKYCEYGNKWSMLQKHLPGRTQTKIKNYFYGNIRYFLKIIIKHFHKKSTGFVNDIKTETLLELYEAKNNFENYTIIPKTIKHLRYRVDKHNCEKVIRQHQEDFRELAQIFISNYLDKNHSMRKGEQSQSQEEESESQPIVKIECPLAPTAVSLMTSVGGEFSQKKCEMEYLKRMSESHYYWYQHFQKAYHNLMEKQISTNVSLDL